MTGLCGVLGDGASLPDAMREWVVGNAAETTFSYADDRLEMELACHPLLAGEQPATVDGGDVAVWVWGDVYGHGSGADYTPRPDAPGGSASYCARHLESKGTEWLGELNGDFALCIHDRTDETVTFVTDRVASHPIYWTRPSSDTIAFASGVQALADHPLVSPGFDLPYLHEYLGCRRVLGIETPLRGVRELHPASIVTVDLVDCSMESTTYWRPSHDPVDRPFSHFVDELVDALTDIFAEWTRDDLEYGLLLSGGKDSRFVEASIDQSVIAFHSNDWMNREARTARRVAETAGDEFRLLVRGDDYGARTLASNPRLSNFSGWFDQAYFTPHEEEIREEVDVLVSGLYADTLFDGGTLPLRELSLGPIGTVELPYDRPIEDVDDYVDATLAPVGDLSYLTSDSSLRDVLAANVRETDDGVVSHGIRFESLDDLVMYGGYYPLSADTEAIFTRSLAELLPYRTPFTDTRLLDLQQRIPTEYLLRRDLVGAALEQIAPDLAVIPHAETGVAPARPYAIQYVGGFLRAFSRKFLVDDSGPEPHLDHGPWPNRRELLRTRSFARDAVRANDDLLRRFQYVDQQEVEQMLWAHEAGEDHQPALYSLLTLLEMPVTERCVQSPSAPVESRAPNPGSDRPTRS